MTSSDPYALWDAAYVLGSLSAAERRDYEAHLHACPDCRCQVAELSGIPGLLALGREENTPASPAPESAGPVPLYAGLAAKVARRRRRFAMAAAAAALVLAGTTAAITTAAGPGSAPPPAAVSSTFPGVPLTFAGPSPRGLAATGSLASFPWGTQISWRCSYAAGSAYRGGSAGQRYVLVLVTTSGSEATVASWTAGPGSVVTPTAATSTPAAQIARLEIRDSTGAALLSAAP